MLSVKANFLGCLSLLNKYTTSDLLFHVATRRDQTFQNSANPDCQNKFSLIENKLAGTGTLLNFHLIPLASNGSMLILVVGFLPVFERWFISCADISNTSLYSPKNASRLHSEIKGRKYVAFVKFFNSSNAFGAFSCADSVCAFLCVASEVFSYC